MTRVAALAQQPFSAEWQSGVLITVTPQLAIHVVSDALLVAFWICAPLLLISFTLGIIINLIQIATSLQDQVFSTVPRLAACLAGLLLLLPWMLSRASGYAVSVLRDLSRYAH